MPPIYFGLNLWYGSEGVAHPIHFDSQENMFFQAFGEKEFTALFHQGRGGNIQLSLVGERALLTALFDDNTTVGMVRLYSTEAAKRLTTIFRRKAQEAEQQEAVGEPNETSEDAGFLPEGQGALDDLFGSD